jgi:hypothetical protein
MKIKTASRVLGAAYLLCALVFFLVMSRCQVAFAEQGTALPTPSRAAFAIGPSGWLIVTAVVGAMAVLKDLAFPWRGWNFAFSIVLITMVFFVAFAMIVPTIPVQAQSVPATRGLHWMRRSCSVCFLDVTGAATVSPNVKQHPTS